MIDARSASCVVVEPKVSSERATRQRSLFGRDLLIQGSLVAGVLALGFSFGQRAGAVQKTEKTIEADVVVAKKFRLIGANGKPSALLVSSENGDATLAFYDKNQVARLRVGLAANRPGLSVLSEGGQELLSMFIDPELGTPNVMLSSRRALEPSALLTIARQGARLLFSDTGGHRLSLGLNSDGEPHLNLRGTRDGQGIAVTSGAGHGPRISMISGGSRKSVSWTMLEDGLPATFVTDATGKVFLTLQVGKNGNTESRKPPPE